MNDKCSKKIIIIKMIKLVAKNLSASDVDASSRIDEERTSKNISTTDQWKKCYNKAVNFDVSSINTTLAEV